MKYFTYACRKAAGEIAFNPLTHTLPRTEKFWKLMYLWYQCQRFHITITWSIKGRHCNYRCRVVITTAMEFNSTCTNDMYRMNENVHTPLSCFVLFGFLNVLNRNIYIYPMLRADSRFWLVNNREIWSRISRLTSSAWDCKTKERHWWRHNGDSDRRPLSLPLRYDLVILCLYDDLGQINVIAGILRLRKRFRMSQILSEHGINSLPLVCFRGYGNLSTLSIAIPRLAFGRAWYCDAACG